MVMLRCIQRSLLHTSGSSCNPSRCRTLMVANTKGNALTGVSRQCWRRQPEPQQLLPSRLSMQLMSSISSSLARSRGSSKDAKRRGSEEQLVAPHGELPRNLKLAEEVMERLRTLDEREGQEASSQDIDGNEGKKQRGRLSTLSCDE